MCQPVPIGQATSPFFRKPSYGLGVMLDPESACGEKIGHGGDGPGYNTWVMHLPDFKGRKLTIAIFCNTSMAAHPFSLIDDLLYVLGAVEDGFFPEQVIHETAADIKGAKAMIIPGSHLYYVERPVEFSEAVIQFLQACQF